MPIAADSDAAPATVIRSFHTYLRVRTWESDGYEGPASPETGLDPGITCVAAGDTADSGCPPPRVKIFELHPQGLPVLLKAHINLLWPLVLVSVPVHIFALGPWWQNPVEHRVETTSNPLHILLTRGGTTIPSAPSADARTPSPTPVQKKPAPKHIAAKPVTVARNDYKIPLPVERGANGKPFRLDNPVMPAIKKVSIQPQIPPAPVQTPVQKPVETSLLPSQSQDDETLKARIRDQLNIRIRFHRVYPRLAIRNAWQGQVDLGIHILANGTLSHIRVLRSSGHSILDKAAMQSLQRVAILPEAEDWLQGRDYDVILPVIYRLQDS